MLDQTLKFWMDLFRVFLDEVGDVVDVIMIGDDLAGQNGPLFNPANLPPHRQAAPQSGWCNTSAPAPSQSLVSHVRRLHGFLIPETHRQRRADSQPGAGQRAQHGPGRAQAPFRTANGVLGRGVDAQHILPRALPAEVPENVRRNVKALMPGGGYVFKNVQNIQVEVSAAG